MSNLVYKIRCGGSDNKQCERVYVGTPGTKLKTRIAAQGTALSNHCRDFKNNPDFEYFIYKNRNDRKLEKLLKKKYTSNKMKNKSIYI